MHNTAAGAVTGFVAGMATGLISTGLFLMDICQLCLIRIGGGLFMRSMLTETSLAWTVIGWLSHLTVSIVLGVILAYILSFTGKDFALLKGAIFGAVVWVVTIGFISPLAGYISARPSPGDIILVFVYHVLFGLIAAWLLVRYSDVAETKRPKRDNPI